MKLFCGASFSLQRRLQPAGHQAGNRLKPMRQTKVRATLLACFALCAYGQDGAKLFESHCAGCHGVDGAGGEHGPTIVENGRRRAEANLRETIKNGIKEGGMPAFSFTDAEMNALVAHVTKLRAPAADHPATAGDAQAGQRVFFGQGNCTRCHMIKGRGGVLGPDLTNVAREKRLAQIEQALARPETLTTPGYRPVTVRLKDGKVFSGIARNESNYDLQLQGADGALHILSKSQIASETREPKSLMPVVEASRVPDLLAFLSRLTSETAPSVDAVSASAAGISFEQIVHPNPGDWPTYHGKITGNRHSDLKQIDLSNVGHLAPAWMFPIAGAQRLEGTPIVVDGIMYVTTANECYALDAKNGRQIWHYQRPLTKGVIGDAASAINRGVAVLRDKVFMITDHAHIIALNRMTGHLLWDTEMADFRRHYGATGAPLVVGDLVLSGTSGGDEGAPGFIAAYHVDTGAQAWRFSTIEGPRTWVGRAIEHGCVDAWFTGTYDPATDLIFWPTGNPCPDYNGDERKGDNLYADSVVALEPKTGKLRWYYQFTPHDLHDWDAVAPLLAIDAPFKGKPRQLMMQGNRNGFFYVLDRTTGEFLLGQPFVKKMDWADGIDEKGRPRVRASATPTPEGTKTCPNVAGATNWYSSAYNPDTTLFYLMAVESCSIYTKSDAWWEPSKSFYGGGTRRVPGETPERFLRALDIQTGKIVWEIPQIGGAGGWGGVVSTAGGLVFFCDESGALAAADAKSGKLLWHFHTNQQWHASPMTYAVEGGQFVAVEAGSNIISFALP
jgi:alcohol dehydrogenase (cytochrome c)